MNLVLDDESRLALVHYRLERAKQAIKEAQLLAAENFFNAAISRMYYSCFYAALALLIHNGLQAKTHAGVKSMLGLHFVSTGVLPRDCGYTFNELFEKRHQSDYDDFLMCDSEMVEALLPETSTFVEVVNKLCNQSPTVITSND